MTDRVVALNDKATLRLQLNGNWLALSRRDRDLIEEILRAVDDYERPRKKTGVLVLKTSGEDS